MESKDSFNGPVEDALYALDSGALMKSKPALLKGVRMRGTFCVLPKANATNTGEEVIGPVKVRFTFGIAYPTRNASGLTIDTSNHASVVSKPESFMFDEPGNDPWYYKDPRKFRLGASFPTATTNWGLNTIDHGLDHNSLRYRKQFKMITQKTICVNGVQIAPIANNDNDDYQLTAHTLGKTVEIDWYIPTNLTYSSLGTSEDLPKVICVVEDLSHTLQSCHFATATTVGPDDSSPSNWAILSSTYHKQCQLETPATAVDNRQITFNMRSFWVQASI